ncbi:hypothetical protein E4T47_02995 [Aureobasidium subglaciale]|nr:hypothetical protein E4T47_02995 [Aureobasidium subglaciale]
MATYSYDINDLSLIPEPIRRSHLYDSELLSNLNICFSDQIVRAHKLIGHATGIVYSMIKYIYGCPVEVPGDDEIDLPFLCDLFLIANEYDVPTLRRSITGFVVGEIRMIPVCVGDTRSYISGIGKEKLRFLLEGIAELYEENEVADRSLLEDVVDVYLEVTPGFDWLQSHLDIANMLQRRDPFLATLISRWRPRQQLPGSYNDKKSSDIALCFGDGRNVYAHRILLQGASEVFHTAINSMLPIATQDTYDIPGYCGLIVDTMIRHIYGMALDFKPAGIPPNDRLKYLFDIFHIANEYQMPSLGQAVTQTVFERIIKLLKICQMNRSGEKIVSRTGSPTIRYWVE